MVMQPTTDLPAVRFPAGLSLVQPLLSANFFDPPPPLINLNGCDVEKQTYSARRGVGMT